MRYLHFLLFALLLRAAVPAVAQEPAFGNFQDRTALFSVRSLAQQDDGTVWFGTDRCLYSFDGYDLVPYPCPDGHIQINKLIYWDGRLLLATNDGIYSFLLDKRAYVRATPFDDDLVRDLLSVGEYIYVASKNGFFRYDPEADTATRIDDGNSFSLVLAGEDIYVGLLTGIGRYCLPSGTFERPFPALLVRIVTCILPDGEHLWVCSPTHLFRVRRSDGHVDASVALPMPKALWQGPSGRLLIGTDNGLFRYDPAENVQERIHPAVTWNIMEDRDGDLWFGTEEGLLHLQQSPTLRPVEGLTNSGNAHYNVLLRDRKGRLWAGGSGGLYQVSEDGQTRHYAMDAPDYRIPHNKVRKIVESRQTGDVYIGSDGGILHYDEASGQMLRMLIPGNNNWIYDLLPLGNELWAATFEGVYRLRLDGNVLNRYRQQEGLSSDDVARIVQDRQGRIWALTRDQHVFRIDPGTGEVLRIDTGPDQPDCMCSDNDGCIWVASGNRISRIIPEAGGVEIRSTQFHPDGNIEPFSLIEAEGRIWICTSQTLFSVGKDELDIRSFSTYRNYVAFEYDPFERSLLLGAAGGVDRVRLEDIRRYYESTPSTIIITSLVVNGQRRIDPRDFSGEVLQLPHNQNHLEISFSDFNFNDEIPHRFDYRLDSRREHWSGTVVGNKVTLTGLRSGRYSLSVAPADTSSNPARILSFRIRSSWPLSPPMLLLYFLLFAAIIYSVVKLATMRRYLELERRQRDELIEQSRQKEAFFQDVAHEFKTPLSLVIGPLGKLIKEAAPGTDITNLEIARDNAMRLSTLIHHTIDYYKDTGGVADSLISSEVEFVDFARSIFEAWRDNFPKHEFIFSSSHPTIPVNIDIVKIETVLNNLLSNACKYTPEGGSVLMTLDRDDHGRQLLIKVSDTGIGIPREEQPFAFQRYFESSRTKSGGYDSTGIGLSVIKKYVEMHGGQVSLSSDEDGTTFSILLPCLADSTPSAAGTPGAPVDEDSDKPLIAIVDDNAQICNFLESLLKDDYRCVCSHNGKSGLKLCKDVIPDLIISDVLMPVMDGLEMCRQIRQFPPLSTIPIILLTAKDDHQTEQKSIGLGIDVFLPKPFEVPTLTARVSQLLGNKKRMEQKLRMEMLTTPEASRELSQDEKYLRKVTQLIEEHLDDADLSVARLCELGDFSEKQLYRKLKQFTGMSAVEYIRSIRLKKAALLLQSGNFTISEVMYSVGFSNASYFTRTFSTAYNMTPSEYMKSFKKQV